MPSPFPGMDPFIESQKWEGFHHAAISVMCELLASQVADRYVVNIEERVYLEDSWGNEGIAIPDVNVVEANERATINPTGTASATAIAPVQCLLPEPEPHQEGYLEIRTTDGNQLITVIELLSPTNKLAGSDGRRSYVRKRNSLLQTEVNLVEIDVLRGGSRLPMRSSLPSGDYYVLVSRELYRPRCDVFAWTLSDRMPSIPIPLSKGVPEPLLDLQSVLNLVYDRGIYRLSLKYNQQVIPPIAETEERWLRSVIGSANRTSTGA